jgi:hypothetical protein
MKLEFSPRVAASHVYLARPLGAHLILREIGADAEGRARTPLAHHAMTDAHERRLIGRLRAQRPAAATAILVIGNLPFLALSPPYTVHDPAVSDWVAAYNALSPPHSGSVSSLCPNRPYDTHPSCDGRLVRSARALARSSARKMPIQIVARPPAIDFAPPQPVPSAQKRR